MEILIDVATFTAIEFWNSEYFGFRKNVKKEIQQLLNHSQKSYTKIMHYRVLTHINWRSIKTLKTLGSPGPLLPIQVDFSSQFL